MPRFAVRLRAYSAAHFELADVLTLRWRDAVGMLQSEYTGGDDGLAYPVTLHGEIRGEGRTLEEAQRRLGDVLSNVFPLIAVAANAAISTPLAVAAHGLDLPKPQPFIAYANPLPHEWFPPGIRKISIAETLAFFDAIDKLANQEMFLRCTEMYRQALTYKTPETGLLSGEFLYIAAETLSRFLIETRAAERGIPPRALAKSEGLTSTDGLREQYLRDDVFAGDQTAYKAMVKASSGFEHGYMSIEKTRHHFASAIELSFDLVRRALITATGVSQEHANVLLGPDYSEPRSLVPVMRVVRGTMELKDAAQPVDELDGGAFDLEWESNVVDKAAKKPDGSVDLTFSPKITVGHIDDRLKLNISSTGIRAANVTKRRVVS